MRNFDQEILRPAEDLTFQIGGETFTMMYVRPEVMAEYEDERAEEIQRLREEQKQAEADGGDGFVYIPNDAAQTIERLDRRIKSFLRAEDHGRWDALRARTEAPVPYAQLVELERWMVQTQTVRPTQTPSPSAGGRGRTGRSSSARQSSPEATPV